MFSTQDKDGRMSFVAHLVEVLAFSERSILHTSKQTVAWCVVVSQNISENFPPLAGWDARLTLTLTINCGKIQNPVPSCQNAFCMSRHDSSSCLVHGLLILSLDRSCMPPPLPPFRKSHGRRRRTAASAFLPRGKRVDEFRLPRKNLGQTQLTQALVRGTQ